MRALPAGHGRHGGEDDTGELRAAAAGLAEAEAERLAKAEGSTLNQFINVAAAEKIAALRTADFFRERARRADPKAGLALLDTIGTDETPRPGDEPEEG